MVVVVHAGSLQNNELIALAAIGFKIYFILKLNAKKRL